MRLLYVHDRFGAMAGAEVNVLASAAALRRRGHVPGLLHGPPTGQGETDWRVVFHDRFALGSTDCAGVAAAAVRAFGPDAVYVHKLSHAGVLQALADSGRPVVRMVHDHELCCLRSYKYFPWSRRICTRPAGLFCVFPCGAVLARNRRGGFPVQWRSYRGKQAELRLNRRFHRMIVAGDYMKSELLRNGFDPRRIEVHPPVSPESGPLPQSTFSARNRLVYSGQVIRGKGVDVLLECLARVRVPFECLVLGDGHDRPRCEALSRKLGLEGRVRFLGYLPPAELPAWYAEASLAVVSSVWPEPFGAVGLEAMRHGLPVVAFDVGGISAWLRDGQTGYLVPWMDRDRFAARIEQLLRDKTLARQLGENGRRLAAGRFGFENYSARLENMFARVLAEAAGSPDSVAAVAAGGSS